MNLGRQPAARGDPCNGRRQSTSGCQCRQRLALTISTTSLLANDTDPNSDPLAVTGVSGAVNCTVSFDEHSNTVTFTPTSGYTGPASFSYAIADGRGGTASATASLDVVAPSGWDDTWGDRRQELVFIGSDMNEAYMNSAGCVPRWNGEWVRSAGLAEPQRPVSALEFFGSRKPTWRWVRLFSA